MGFIRGADQVGPSAWRARLIFDFANEICECHGTKKRHTNGTKLVEPVNGIDRNDVGVLQLGQIFCLSTHIGGDFQSHMTVREVTLSGQKNLSKRAFP